MTRAIVGELVRRTSSWTAPASASPCLISRLVARGGLFRWDGSPRPPLEHPIEQAVPIDKLVLEDQSYVRAKKAKNTM